MKPNSGFVAACLAFASVTCVQHITAEHINADFVREMDKAFTPTAREAFLELTSEADKECKPKEMKASGKDYIDSGFSEMSEDEAYLIPLIYTVNGRKVVISASGITVHPSKTVLEAKRRQERMSALQVA
jgi:hypothetical protein